MTILVTWPAFGTGKMPSEPVEFMPPNLAHVSKMNSLSQLLFFLFWRFMDCVQNFFLIHSEFYHSCISLFPCLIIGQVRVGVVTYCIPEGFLFDDLQIPSLVYSCFPFQMFRNFLLRVSKHQSCRSTIAELALKLVRKVFFFLVCLFSFGSWRFQGFAPTTKVESKLFFCEF